MSRCVMVAAAGIVCLALLAATARAGTWVQVSCVNPNGSAAGNEGWSAGSSGPPSVVDSADTECGPGRPLVAAQNFIYATPPSVGNIEGVTYTPPPGSALAGGSIDASLEAYGYGGGFTAAAVLSAQGQGQGSNIVKVVSCNGQNCSGNTFGPGVVSLPAGQAGTVAVDVGCASLVQGSTAQCNQSNNGSVYDRVRVYSADLLLTTNAQPQAANFGGSVLDGNASGTAGLVFTASDPAGLGTNPPSGPGIYFVTVEVDGHAVYAQTPDTKGGTCVPVGGGGGQPLMFDTQQPCPPVETIFAPVPTGGLRDGRHRLTVTVTDAAGETAAVLDRYITIHNTQVTPVPRGHKAVRAHFLLHWTWNGPRTTLDWIHLFNLPANPRMSLVCRGGGCPHLATSASGTSGVNRVLRRLGGRSFSAGQRLYLTVTAPGRKAERIVLGIRDGRIPACRLFTGSHDRSGRSCS